MWALEGRFTLAFARPSEALNCALACQRAVAARAWPPQVAPLRVRMALDTGEASVHEGGYRGRVLDRATGLLLAAHGGQILCSEAFAALLPADPDGRLSLVDVGYHRLRGRDVPDRLYAVTDPETPADAVPLPRAALAHRSNVPAQLTRFFGRERELQGVRDALLDDGVRMVTLTGPGGSGKTRLAIAVAEQVVETFAGAIWFVPFEQLTEPDLIAEAVVNAMGLPQSPGMQPLAQAAEVLSRQPSLLVLDSFEHLVDDGGPVIADLLQRTPTLKYLVTSRRSLNLAAETEFLVQPLPVPGGTRTPEDLMRCPSVELFVDRAQAKRPDFQVTNGSADAIGELCDRLEGLPLAIELAAGWASVLSPARMLSQLGDRFGFLVAHERGADERHRTLQAAVDWSYELLPQELQRLFAELSVFRGGWTAEAAQAVCSEGQVLEGLRALRERSLVVVDDEPEGTGDPRYHLLETLREYGWARLTTKQRAALQQRHAQYYLARAQKARPQLAGPDEHARLKQLSSEQHNFRAVLSWASSADGDLRAGLRLSIALYPFWTTHGHITEARTFVNRLLAHKDVGPEIGWVRASVLDNAGYLARIQADFPAARAHLEEALTVRRELGDEIGMTQSLFRLALVAMDQHDFETAERSLAKSRHICHQMGLAGEMAQCLMTLGALALNQGDHARAEARMQQALAIRRKSGYPLGEVACLRRLGAIALDQGEYGQAQVHYREALSLARQVGHSLETARSLNDLGSLAREQRKYGQARKLHEEALAVYEDAENVQGIAETLDRLGQVAFDRGQYDRAQTIHEEALAIFRELGFVRGIPWTLHHLGAVALRRGDPPGAAAVLRESLVRFRDIHSQVGAVASLDGLAEVARAEENLVHAAHLHAAADALRQRTPRPAADRTLVSIAPDPSALRSAMGEDTFTAAWAQGQEMPLDQAIDYALAPPESS